MHLLVNARYETVPSKVQGLEGIATEVAGALQKTAAGLESGGAASGLNGLAAGSALANEKEQLVPQAYLNYLLYDENYQLIDQGFQQVSKAAAVGKSNPSATPEELALEVSIEKEGYLYTYLSNEASASSSAVYFDDFTVEQQSYIVQVDDYYPFGASFDQNVGRVLENKYLWSGKERQTDLNLGWDDFGARFYDPVLGRFHTQDRFADKYHPMTPYQYAANNPIRYIDINGDSIDVYDPSGALVTTLDNGKETVTGMYFQNSKTNKKGKTTYSNGVSFEYNDAELDRAGAKNDGLRVRFADRDINTVMDQSGVNSSEAQDSPWSYIERESRPSGDEAVLSSEKSSGKMDYLNYTKYGYLNIVRGPNGDRVAYNDYDYGNFLWGMGGNRLGFSYRTLQVASQLNNAVNSGSDNPGVPYRLLDSNADQRAIRNGYYYGARPQKSDPQK